MTDVQSDIKELRTENARLLRQLRELLDKDAIASCIRRVARALDRLDRQLLAAQFHPDAEVDYGRIYKGPVAGFVDVTMQFQGAMRDTQHLVSNVEISVDGDTAVAESYVYAHHMLQAADQVMELIVGGRYLDRFTRRGDEWKIAFRTEVLDWGRMVPVTERWFEENNELPKGRRDPQDLSYEMLARR